MEGTAIVFIASERGRSTKTRALWRVSVEDAKRICTDPRTKGRRSALFWTAKAIDYEFVTDSGQHAEVLKELGVTVLESKALPASEGKNPPYVGKHRVTAKA